MSKEREVEVTVGSPEWSKLPSSEKKARLARVLSRSTAMDHLLVNLPDDIYGEWVHNDPISINSKEMLGFKVDDTYARSNAIHGSGTGPVKVSDVVFMVCPKELHLLKEEIDRETYDRIHGKVTDGSIKTQSEEIEFTGKQSEVGLPLIQDSTTRVSTGDQLQAALGAE